MIGQKGRLSGGPEQAKGRAGHILFSAPFAYTESMKAQDRRRGKRWKKRLIILAGVLLALFCYAVFVVNPYVLSVSSVQAEAETVASVNLALYESLQSCDYEDLVTIRFDDADRVTFLSYNSFSVNRLAYSSALAVQERLLTDEVSVRVPAGVFTGIGLLSDLGWQVRIPVRPVGAPVCRFVSEFGSAGINQTLHAVYLEVETEMRLILPLMSRPMTVSHRLLVAESVIVGEIPEVFVQLMGEGSGSESALDLLP